MKQGVYFRLKSTSAIHSRNKCQQLAKLEDKKKKRKNKKKVYGWLHGFDIYEYAYMRVAKRLHKPTVHTLDLRLPRHPVTILG